MNEDPDFTDEDVEYIAVQILKGRSAPSWAPRYLVNEALDLAYAPEGDDR